MMIFNSPDYRLQHVPWVAVAGEIMTAVCFGCLCLFEPLLKWVTWPELLFSWHFALVVIGSIAIALGLVRRRPGALKAAIVLAAYNRLPSLLSLSQAIGQVSSAADQQALLISFVVWGFGMFGQVAVISPCLGRLAPKQELVPSDASSPGVRTPNGGRGSVVGIDGEIG
jgi:hypothetical protein